MKRADFSVLFQSSKKFDAAHSSRAIDDGADVANDDHRDDDRNNEGDDEDDSGHREKAPSSHTSESGEINILDDFSEDEQDREGDEDKLKPFAENLEEAVALTMQVNWGRRV